MPIPASSALLMRRATTYVVRSVAGGLVMMLGAACRGDGGSSDSPSLPARVPAMVAVKELDIGREDDRNYALTRVGDLAISPLGEVLVSQPREYLIRAYDSTGRFVRAIGRRGNGPGEFQSIFRVGIHDDTLFVIDRDSRYHYYTFDGRLIRTVREPEPIPALPYLGTTPYRLSGGWKLMMASARAPDLLRGAVPAVLPLWIVRPDGTVHDSLPGEAPALIAYPDVPGTPTGIVLRGVPVRAQFDTAYNYVPFSGSTLFAVAPDGRSIVRVEQRTPVDTLPVSFTVVRYGAHGDSLNAASVVVDPISVPAAISDSAILAAATQLRSRFGELDPALRLVRSRMTVPTRYMPVQRIVIGSRGSIWLERQGSPDREWLVLDTNLAPVAVVSLPTGLDLKAVDGDTVWGIELNPDDVPHVVRHRVQAR